MNNEKPSATASILHVHSTALTFNDGFQGDGGAAAKNTSKKATMKEKSPTDGTSSSAVGESRLSASAPEFSFGPDVRAFKPGVTAFKKKKLPHYVSSSYQDDNDDDNEAAMLAAAMAMSLKPQANPSFFSKDDASGESTNQGLLQDMTDAKGDAAACAAAHLKNSSGFDARKTTLTGDQVATFHRIEGTVPEGQRLPNRRPSMVVLAPLDVAARAMVGSQPSRIYATLATYNEPDLQACFAQQRFLLDAHFNLNPVSLTIYSIS